MIFKTEHVIEGLNPEGEWHLLAPVDPSCDQLAQRDAVARTLRDMEVKRYTKVRLAKYVTTIEVVGEDITV